MALRKRLRARLGWLKRKVAHAMRAPGRVPPFEPIPFPAMGVPPEVRACPTMLALGELRALMWLTRDYYTGSGRIVDAGCFLGGSTVALGVGLRANRRVTWPAPPIEVYDLFRVDRFSAVAYADAVEHRDVGASTRDLFDRYTAGVRELVRVHEGDVTREPWSGEPIEILFIDLAKTWDISDWLLRQYFPSLLAGRAIVVQQDYLFSGCPWLHPAMEVLAPCFEIVGHVGSSVLYRALRAPSREEIEAACAVRGDVRLCLELFDRAIERFAPPERGIIGAAKAVFAAHMQGLEVGSRMLAEARPLCLLSRKGQLTLDEVEETFADADAFERQGKLFGVTRAA